MAQPLLVALYLVGLVIAEGLRFPRRLARARSAEAWRRPGGKRSAGEFLVLGSLLSGVWILPAIYISTHWLGALDYTLPAWAARPAAGIFALGLLLRWRAQVDLGREWSPTVELGDQHCLVNKGIYARIRHPIYASLILWGLAQPVLLQNVAAGWVGPLAVVLVWLVRVPAEEKMMLQRYGEEYARYMEQTGRAIPRMRKKAA